MGTSERTDKDVTGFLFIYMQIHKNVLNAENWLNPLSTVPDQLNGF